MKYKATIGIADNHAVARKGFVNLLTEMGNNVSVEANNGNDLLAQIDSLNNKPDLCIIDQNLPLLNCFETIDTLKTKWPAIKTLVLINYYCEHNIVRFLKQGVNGCISKKSELTEIKNALTDIIDNGIHYSKWEIRNSRSVLDHKKDINMLFLTDHEIRFLEYCCTELTYKEIASKMKTTLHVIDGYRNVLFKKLDVKSRTGLTLFAIKAGFFSLDEQ
jgi:two-component system invasion response regulator UvrY